MQRCQPRDLVCASTGYVANVPDVDGRIREWRGKQPLLFRLESVALAAVVVQKARRRVAVPWRSTPVQTALLLTRAGRRADALQLLERPRPLATLDGELGVRGAAEVVDTTRVPLEVDRLLTAVELALVAAAVRVRQRGTERLVGVGAPAVVVFNL